MRLEKSRSLFQVLFARIGHSVLLTFAMIHFVCLQHLILHNHCFQFFLGFEIIPRKIENSNFIRLMQNFGGQIKCIVGNVEVGNSRPKEHPSASGNKYLLPSVKNLVGQYFYTSFFQQLIMMWASLWKNSCWFCKLITSNYEFKHHAVWRLLRWSHGR